MTEAALGASFRDPSGFVFERDGAIYRQVNRCYAPDYDLLMSSGLYRSLTEQRLLIPHREVPGSRESGGEAYLIIQPERVGFVSYPYEWCFGQLRDAALTTLRVQETALRFGMVLKDASAYNVQLHRGCPAFIDTLSFTRYQPGSPWVAYRQFCQHFLAPLALMAHRDIRLGKLLRSHIDGIPLDLARSLLPMRAWLDPHLLLHIRVHAAYQRRYQGRAETSARTRPLSRQKLANLIAALRAAVSKLDWRPEGTVWADYSTADSYSAASSEHKKALVAGYLDRIAPRVVWDLGANVGSFSRLASDRGIQTLAFDADPACVERNYRRVRKAGEESLLPLVVDLANPSPALGWANRERAALFERRSADALMALALIHHLAISNNVPLERIAASFAELAEHLIVEFVPKADPKVRVLLATREDVFPGYTQEGFEAAFGRFFETRDAQTIEGSQRRLYWMRRRAPG